MAGGTEKQIPKRNDRKKSKGNGKNKSGFFPFAALRSE
jgi:hypothetical protein